MRGSDWLRASHLRRCLLACRCRWRWSGSRGRRAAGQHLHSLRLFAGSSERPIRRLGPSQWLVDLDQLEPLTLDYTVKARDLTVRTCYLDPDVAALCLADRGQQNLPDLSFSFAPVPNWLTRPFFPPPWPRRENPEGAKCKSGRRATHHLATSQKPVGDELARPNGHGAFGRHTASQDGPVSANSAAGSSAAGEHSWRRRWSEPARPSALSQHNAACTLLQATICIFLSTQTCSLRAPSDRGGVAASLLAPMWALGHYFAIQTLGRHEAGCMRTKP